MLVTVALLVTQLRRGRVRLGEASREVAQAGFNRGLLPAPPPPPPPPEASYFVYLFLSLESSLLCVLCSQEDLCGLY